jgi:ATP-dependent Clp protease ATP-binding subunit ClpC
MCERFSERARKVMQLANQEAQRFNHEYVGTEHVLLGLIKEGSGTAANVLRKLDVDLRRIRGEIEKIVLAGPERGNVGKLRETPRARKVIEYAIDEAWNMNHNYVGIEHILLGLVREHEGVAAQVLINLNLKLEEVREEVLNLLGHKSHAGAAGASIAAKASNPKTPALDSFGRDLTDLARQGKLHPAIGRHREIELVVQILSSGTGSNPVLLGEPGVGKTAIVEGLAQRIADGNVPSLLRDRRVVFLDTGLMSSGVKNHGQFEERIRVVLSEVRKARNIIIYLDDLGTLTSGGESNVRPLNRLRYALARGEIQFVAEATPEKYRSFVEREGALEGWFQTVVIDPSSKGESLDILRALRGRYEARHRAQITEEALEAAVDLSELYLPDQHLPLKAVDLIDKAGSRVRLMALPRPPELRELDEEIDRLNQDKEEAIANQEFDRACTLRDRADRLKKKQEMMTREWREQLKEVDGTVDARVIEEVVSRASGVPLEAVRKRDTGGARSSSST